MPEKSTIKRGGCTVFDSPQMQRAAILLQIETQRDFRKEIRKLIDQSGISHKSLAELAGIATASLHNWAYASGARKRPTQESLAKIIWAVEEAGNETVVDPTLSEAAKMLHPANRAILKDKIEKLIEDTGMTVYKIDRATGIHESSLSVWRRGKEVPSVRMLHKLIEFSKSCVAKTTKTSVENLNASDAALKAIRENSSFENFKAAAMLYWPHTDFHKWFELIMHGFCEHEITVVIGPGDAAKTYAISQIALLDYWANPDDTLSLISTTEGRGSELRVWGVVKDLFNEAKERFPMIPGKPLDHLKTLTTDSLDPKRELARSLRRGLIIIPCKTGGTVSGLAPYVGIKSNRLRHFGDEVALMTSAFLNAYSNWYGKPNFRGMMTGNFMSFDDPLGQASEPEHGWGAYDESEKDQCWKSKFFGAHVIALDGRDSPNFQPPWQPGEPPKYPYLIGEKKFNAVRKTYGENSWQWFSQCLGKPSLTSLWNRVITRAMCDLHKVTEDVTWAGDTPITALYAIDPAYGGGDRCVGLVGQMGTDIHGHKILRVGEPEIIPVSAKIGMGEPEDQIAAYAKRRLETIGIAPDQCFYDSFGRGTLGNAFAKLFGRQCPVPVDSGQQPSRRPVRFDLLVEDERGNKRLKRCDEHYSKFVTELWFSIREAIESDQIKNLSNDIIDELVVRTFSIVRGNKQEVESKGDLKERLRCSPDLADTLGVLVEGARQRGFKIKRSGEAVEAVKHKNGEDWLAKEAREYSELLQSRQAVGAGRR